MVIYYVICIILLRNPFANCILFWNIGSVAGWIANILIKMISLRLTVRIHHFKCSLKNLFKFKCSNSMLQWKKIKEENLKDGMDLIQESFRHHCSDWWTNQNELDQFKKRKSHFKSTRIKIEFGCIEKIRRWIIRKRQKRNSKQK